MLKYIKTSHIKAKYVREACYVVGVLFFPVSHIRIITASVVPQPVAQVKPPVVAEWGSGVTPRHDPDTISKHVKQMVDVSMRLCNKPQSFTSLLPDRLKQN